MSNGSVHAFSVFDDGSGPALFTGGDFATSPAGDSYLAKWGCPAGARTYGGASPGCAGALAIGVTSPPRVASAAFAITCTNAPPSAPGVLLAGIPLMAPVPILGLQIWVSPLLSLNVASDASGSATIPIAIRADPLLVGLQFDLQLLWLGPTAPPPCPPLGLSASNALQLTIQP